MSRAAEKAGLGVAVAKAEDELVVASSSLSLDKLPSPRDAKNAPPARATAPPAPIRSKERRDNVRGKGGFRR